MDSYIITEEIEKYVKKRLTEKRYIHSLGVAKMAETLARKYDLNSDKAYFAGYLHDIAKCMTVEESNRMVRYYGLDLKYLYNTALAHSKIGAEIVYDRFGVDDPEILRAVANHTTGRAYMSPMEEVLYVSDAVERNRKYDGVVRLRHLAKFNLDEACLEILNYSIGDLKDKGREIDPDTLEARKYIKERLKG